MGRTGILKFGIWMLMQAGVNWKLLGKDIFPEDTLKISRRHLSRRHPQKNYPRKKQQNSSAEIAVTSGIQAPLSAWLFTRSGFP